jgi:hypothetical protein
MIRFTTAKPEDLQAPKKEASRPVAPAPLEDVAEPAAEVKPAKSKKSKGFGAKAKPEREA